MSALRLFLPLATVLCLLAPSAAQAVPAVWSVGPQAAPPRAVGFSLDQSDVKTGTRVTGLVTVAADDEERVVRVERAMPEGWVLVRSAALPAAATEVQVPIPTGYYSTYSYRVSLTTKWGEVSSPEQSLKVGPAYVPAGRSADWSYAAGDQRWDSCSGPIRYLVNKKQAWPGAVAETREALRRISHATGIQFVWAGFTTMVPKGAPGQRLANDADLVIAWLRANQTPLLSGNALGEARFFTDGLGQITRAQVAIDRAGAALKPGFGAAPRRGTLLMHELAHAMGLGHTHRKSQVMHPDISASAARFGAGDLAGLASVGAQRGCRFTTG